MPGVVALTETRSTEGSSLVMVKVPPPCWLADKDTEQQIICIPFPILELPPDTVIVGAVTVTVLVALLV